MMPRFARNVAPAIATLLLIGCSGRGEQASQGIDINGAAIRAQNDVDRYTNEQGQSAASSRATGKPKREPAMAQGETTGPGDPAAIVRAYFAALADHRYDKAATFRENGPTATMLNEEAGRYRGYAAIIGVPGPIDAGAGQLHVTVPVTITDKNGTDNDGGAGKLAGDVVLHRVNDGIESDDPNAHQWRISSIELN